MSSSSSSSSFTSSILWAPMCVYKSSSTKNSFHFCNVLFFIVCFWYFGSANNLSARCELSMTIYTTTRWAASRLYHYKRFEYFLHRHNILNTNRASLKSLFSALFLRRRRRQRAASITKKKTLFSQSSTSINDHTEHKKRKHVRPNRRSNIILISLHIVIGMGVGWMHVLFVLRHSSNLYQLRHVRRGIVLVSWCVLNWKHLISRLTMCKRFQNLANRDEHKLKIENRTRTVVHVRKWMDMVHRVVERGWVDTECVFEFCSIGRVKLSSIKLKIDVIILGMILSVHKMYRPYCQCVFLVFIRNISCCACTHLPNNLLIHHFSSLYPAACCQPPFTCLHVGRYVNQFHLLS